VGLLGEGITEVIATTRNNAAPIGIINRDGVLRVVLFHGSHTSENVARDNWLVANFTFDPVVYVRTAFSDLPLDAFAEEVVEGTHMHRLKETEAWVAFRTEVERDGSESVVVRLTPLSEKTLDLRFHPVNRGFAGIIEATVHATRYVHNHDPWLGKLIEHHASLVRRCGSAREQEALAMLMEYTGEIYSIQ